MKKLVNRNFIHLKVLGAVLQFDMFFDIMCVSELFLKDWTEVRLVFLDMLHVLSVVIFVDKFLMTVQVILI